MKTRTILALALAIIGGLPSPAQAKPPPAISGSKWAFRTAGSGSSAYRLLTLNWKMEDMKPSNDPVTGFKIARKKHPSVSGSYPVQTWQISDSTQRVWDLSSNSDPALKDANIWVFTITPESNNGAETGPGDSVTVIFNAQDASLPAPRPSVPWYPDARLTFHSIPSQTWSTSETPFTCPTQIPQWPRLAGATHFFEFGTGQIKNASDSDLRNAVRELHLAGIGIAIECAGLQESIVSANVDDKPVPTPQFIGEESFNQDKMVFDRVIAAQAAEGVPQRIDYLNFDGPFRRAEAVLELTGGLSIACDELLDAMQLFKTRYPGVKFHFIATTNGWSWDAIPPYSAGLNRNGIAFDDNIGRGNLRQVLNTFKARANARGGATDFEGVLMDVAYSYAAKRNPTDNWDALTYDRMQLLRIIGENCRGTQGYRYGILFTDNIAGSHSNRYTSVALLEYLQAYHATGGPLDEIVVQSWYPMPTEYIPETTAYTMTWTGLKMAENAFGVATVSDDFDDGNFNLGNTRWTVSPTDHWGTTSQQAVTEQNAAFRYATARVKNSSGSFVNAVVGNCVIELDLRLRSETDGAAGIQFCASSSNNTLQNGYRVVMHKQGPTGSSRKLSLYDHSTLLGSSDPFDLADTSEMSHVRIIKNGGRIMVYLNHSSSTLLDVTDATPLSNGIIRLINGGAVKAVFDNVSISEVPSNY
jgi:hypothetical protein